MSAVILFLECLHNVDKNKCIFICVFCKREGLKLVPCAKTWHCLIKYRIMVGMRAFCMLEGVYSNFVDMSLLYCSKSWSFQRTGPRCFKNALLLQPQRCLWYLSTNNLHLTFLPWHSVWMWVCWQWELQKYWILQSILPEAFLLCTADIVNVWKTQTPWRDLTRDLWN